MSHLFRLSLFCAFLGMALVGCDSDSDSSGARLVTLSDANVGDISSEDAGAAVEDAEPTPVPDAEVAAPDAEPIQVVESLTVSPATISDIPGTEVTLSAEVTLTEGGVMDVSDMVAWESSDASVVSIEGQVATIVGAGMATLTATYLDGAGTVNVEGLVCNYPANNGQIGFEQVFPELKWEEAYLPDGTVRRFSTTEFFCSPRYADKETLIIDVGAGWCGPCSRFTRDILNPDAEVLASLGAEILYLEAQDTNYNLASGRFSFRHIGQLIGEGLGWRVGDLETEIRNPQGEWELSPGFVQDSDMVRAFPSVWVVRKRDMNLIADQSRSNFYLPLVSIAEDPEADWSDPPPPPFRSNCLDGEEEDSEPNNVSEDAVRITPGSYEGGICERAPDFYRFIINGPWRATLNFEHAEGDLDFYVYDKRTDQYAVGEDGRYIGSNGTGDVETIEHDGPAILIVFGYNGASANYTLTLEEL